MLARRVLYAVTCLLYVSLAAVPFVLIRQDADLMARTTGVLQLVAAYALVLGFLSALGMFEKMPKLQRELMSPNPVEFLAGNLTAFGVLFGAGSVALNPATRSPGALSLLRLMLVLAGALLFVIYALVHFLVVVPFAYFAYLISSVPVEAVLASGSDLQISDGETSVRLKELVERHAPAIRSFGAALPAVALGIILKVLVLVR